MKAGQLRAWIVFEKNDPTRDAAGGEVDNWITDFGVRAQFQVVGTREFPTFQKRHSETTARFLIRYRTGIDQTLHRINYNGKVWDITDPIPDMRKTQLLIEASETR